MSGRSFRSVFMVASCAGAALGCYLVSLRVASERASLEDVETKIVLAQRDLRVLQTEIGTRGRLAQLERWNVKVLALSAPSADQILGGSFELARLTRPQHQVDLQAPIVLASAPTPEPRTPIEQAEQDETGAQAGTSPGELLHQASLKTETREVPARRIANMPEATLPKSVDRLVTAAKPASSKSTDKPGLAAAKPDTPAIAKHPKKLVDKSVARPTRAVTSALRVAKTDPLAPLTAKSGSAPLKETAKAR